MASSEGEHGNDDECDEETDLGQEEPLLGSSTSYWRSDRSQTTSPCACRYRWVNRAALLVLLWNLLVFSYQYKALDSILKLIPSYRKWEPWEKVSATTAMQISLPFLLYPLAGWLADVKLGRYRVMKGSIWVMWLGSVILLTDSLLQYHFSYTSRNERALQFLSLPVGIAVYALNAIGLAGFQANIIPFGIDQMEDASAEKYSSFVHWYYWSRNFSLGLVLTITLYSSLSCPFSENAEAEELTDRIDLIIVVSEVGFLSLSLLLDFFFSGILIKEPKTQNPLQSVFKVSLFMARHKRPVGLRSAMTYHRGYYSRSDLATVPYGGPFEVEEVEAVKTFWNMTVFLTAVAITSIPVFTIDDVVGELVGPHVESSTHCSLKYLVLEATNPLVFTIALPVYELLIYPLIYKYVLPMTNRVGIGIFLAVLAVVASLIIAILMKKTDKTCLFYHSSSSVHLPVWVLLVPLLFSSFGEMLIFIPAFEFICAQSPYNMRGLLIGLFYALQGIVNGIAALILLVFGSGYSSHKTIDGLFGCEFWFNFVILFIAIAGLGAYLATVRWYRNRQRGYTGQEFVNQQAILEAYYETSD